jgi:ketosteroid isomerase-like protein
VSEQDVEIVRRAFSEFQEGMASGNPAASFDSGISSSDFRWTVPVNAPGMRPVYVGREGWLEFIQTWTEDFEWSIELEKAIDVGEGRVIVNSRQRAVGKTSGVPVELVMGAVYTVEGDQVVSAENYLDPAEALEAAGLSD